MKSMGSSRGVVTIPVGTALPSSSAIFPGGREAGLDDATALKAWYDNIRRSKSPHTVRSYEKEVVRFRIWLEWTRGPDPRLFKYVRAADVPDYLAFLRAPQPIPEEILLRYDRRSQPWRSSLSPDSLDLAKIVLSAMYSTLREIEDNDGQPYCAFNPFVLHRGKTLGATADEGLTAEATAIAREVKKRFFPQEVWGFVERWLENQLQAKPADRKVQRDRWVFHMLYHSWLRRQEAASLTMGSFRQIPSGAWRVDVVGKGGGDEDLVADSFLMDALKRYRISLGLTPYPNKTIADQALPAIVPLRGKKNVTAQSIYTIVTEVLKNVALDVQERMEAGEYSQEDVEIPLTLLRDASPHWLRHTGITHTADMGATLQFVSKQARHKDIKITADRYFHGEDEAARADLEAAKAKLANRQD